MLVAASSSSSGVSFSVSSRSSLGGRVPGEPDHPQDPRAALSSTLWIGAHFSVWILQLGWFVVGRLFSLGLLGSSLSLLPLDPLCRSARLPASPQVLGHLFVVVLLDYLLLYKGVVLTLLYLLLLKLLYVSDRIDLWAFSSSTSLRWRRRLST